jgi:hypothetical protein
MVSPVTLAEPLHVVLSKPLHTTLAWTVGKPRVTAAPHGSPVTSTATDPVGRFTEPKRAMPDPEQGQGEMAPDLAAETLEITGAAQTATPAPAVPLRKSLRECALTASSTPSG